MVDNNVAKRTPGRPLSFDPTAALDAAIDLFWAKGYERSDVDSVARVLGVTKPSLYRMFGDKPSLFLKALQRYGETRESAVLQQFQATSDIGEAVCSFLEASVNAATTTGKPTGCLIACVASGLAEENTDVRSFYARALIQLTDSLTERFESEIAAGRLPPDPSARARGRILADIVQGLALRARAGVARKELLADARSYEGMLLVPRKANDRPVLSANSLSRARPGKKLR
jgi:AcrR family transcriptional regulator